MRSSRRNGGTYGDGMTFPVANAVEEMHHVLVPPVRVMSLPNPHIRSFEAPSLRSGVLHERPT